MRRQQKEEIKERERESQKAREGEGLVHFEGQLQGMFESLSGIVLLVGWGDHLVDFIEPLNSIASRRGLELWTGF